ncbi:hypothetical protein BH24CHL9_BH24CHL9_03640 [soil metagenome]
MDFLGWTPPRVDPLTEAERAWFGSGRRLSDDAAVELAQAVLAVDAS